MNKESPEAIDYIFKIATDVCFDKEDRDIAIQRIYKNYGTNKNSCDMYFRNIFNMLNGERFSVSMSAEATDNILRNFYTYNDGKFFNNSIQSLKHYIKDKNNKGKPIHKMREVLSKWSVKLK